MKKTAIIAAAALLVTLVSGMAFANTNDRIETKENKQMHEQRTAEMRDAYLTDAQQDQLEELRTSYLDSVSDLVKETIAMRSELSDLNNDKYPDYAAIYALETGLWEKMGQLTDAKKAFTAEAKTINSDFPHTVSIF